MGSFDASRLCLGTVQLGLPNYGINNKTGQPSREEAYAMLDAAVAAGVTWFDTAQAYGCAEEILGEYGMQGYKVVTKLLPNCLDELIQERPQEVGAAVREYLEASLKRLRLDKVDGFLLHTLAYQYSRWVQDAMLAVKEAGLTDHIGVSVYEVCQARDAIHSGIWDYLQAPYSALDQRMYWIFTEAKRWNVEVFARAPFTQGLVFMDEPLQNRKHVETFATLCDQYDESRAQVALGFALDSFADHVVFGAETLAQVREDLEPISPDISLYSRIHEELGGCAVVFSSLWGKEVAV